MHVSDFQKGFLSLSLWVGLVFKEKKKLVFLILVGFFLLGILISTVSKYYRLGLGVTSSLPFYLFIVEPGVTPEKGEYVTFYTTDLRPYYEKGIQFGKRIAGVQGDRLSVYGSNYFVNNVFVATAKERDSKGREISRFLPLSCSSDIECYVIIPNGKFFVVADHPMSYDSRYWGYVDNSQVVGKLIPIF